MTRRAAALWLLLFAVYASTLGLDAFGSTDYAGDEPHYLLAAKSLVQDGDLDVKDDFAAREWREFVAGDLRPQSSETDGRLREPHGGALAVLAAPAFAVGGATGVELLLAALAALAIALAYRLALRVAPDPWALGGALAVGLSAPVLAHSTAVYPELAAGAVLAGAALLALELDESVGRRRAFACFALLGLLPWLGLKFVPAGVVIGAYAARSLYRARRRVLAVGSVEVALFSVAFFVGINEALYGGPTPYSAAVPGEGAIEAEFALGVPGARVPAGGAADRPRLRPAALGARVRAGVRGRVVHLPLAARAARACGAAAARDGARGHDVRRGGGGPAAHGRLPRAHGVRPVVPAALPGGRAGADRAAGGARAAPRAASRHRAGAALGGGERVAVARRARGRRWPGGPAAGCAVRAAHRRCCRASTTPRGPTCWRP